MHEFKKGDMAIYVGPPYHVPFGSIVEVNSDLGMKKCSDGNYYLCYEVHVPLMPTVKFAALPQHLKPIPDFSHELETVNDEEIIA